METELGLGTFSKVYSAVDLATSAQVAIKYPLSDEGRVLLAKEAKIMRDLTQCQCTFHTGIPKLVDSSHCPNFIVMEKVGRTLLTLHTEIKRISLKTVLMVGMKAISALEEMHACGYVHRDVKPDNIAIALSPTDPKIYVIDVGLSYKYAHGGQHVQYSEGEVFQGTPFFCSLNALRTLRPTRRDDLEALGYVLIFLLKGDLPWFHVRATHDETVTAVRKMRESTSLKSLCQGLDPEFSEFLDYSQRLAFAEKPNYEYLRGLLATMAERNGLEVDWKYEWSPRGRSNKAKTKTVTDEEAALRLKAEKRRTMGYRMSPSQNMSVLASSIASPGEKKSSRLSSITLPECVYSTDSSTPDLQKTPVHKVSQLPSFSKLTIEAVREQTQVDLGRQPVTAGLGEESAESPVRRPRRYTCDEYSLEGYE